MALKSIIDIELNDLAFQKFIGQYKAYEAALAGAPAAWKAVSAGIDGSRKSFDDLVGAAKSRLTLAKLTAEAEKVASDQLHRATGEATSQARSWSSLAKDSKSFAGNVVGATKSLLRWAEITGVISGILGSGGLFGIDRLAQSAAGQRKDASGIRVTPGELRSFDLNFNRLLNNPTGFLTGVSESLSDVTKAAPYGALGLNYARERQKAPADVAIDVLRAEKSLADRTPQSQLGNTFASRQLGMLGQSVEDFQRIKDRPLAELEEYIKSNQRDKSALNLDQGQLKAWEDFKIQLGRAGDSIEKTFIVALTPLTPQLGKLSASVSALVDAFLRNPDTAKWLDEAAAGIGNFADYIGTPKFKEDVQGLASGISFAAGKIVSGLRLLGLIPDALVTGGNDDKTRDSGGLSGLPAGSPLWRNVPDGEQGNYANSPRSQVFLNNPGGVHPGAIAPEDRSPAWKRRHGLLPRFSSTPEGSPAAFRPGDQSLPRGIRNNNPLNLSYLPGQGAIGTDGRFGVYKTMEEGIAAEQRQFLTYQDKYHLDTLGKVLNRWAPPSDNPAGYPGQISGMTGIGLNDPLNMRDPETARKLFAAMARVENGRPIDPESIRRGVDRGLGRTPSAAPSTQAPPQFAHQFKDRSVQIQIHNNTGGNSNVTLSQLST